MSQQTLGAMLQCYKNPYATYKCIESFRQHYPDSTIVIISDNGYDYTKLAEHFNCIYTDEHLKWDKPPMVVCLLIDLSATLPLKL
jgi:hypothetical protein